MKACAVHSPFRSESQGRMQGTGIGERGGAVTTMTEQTFDLLRGLGMRTILRDPGLKGLPFSQDFPKDFGYYVVAVIV